jgi:uncharacterized short protein YbdD (DUF466 family)
MRASRLGGSVARRFGRAVRGWLAVLRRIAGMPSYEEYVCHLRLKHPSRPIPSEREYFELYLQSRYGDGPTRCC